MTPSEPLVQKPPLLVPAAQVQQPHQPITSPASEQPSNRPSLKNAESTAALVSTIEQLNILPPLVTSTGASKQIVQQQPIRLTRSTVASKPIVQHVRPTPSSGASHLFRMQHQRGHQLKRHHDLGSYLPHLVHQLQLQNKHCSNRLDQLKCQNQLCSNLFGLLLQMEHQPCSATNNESHAPCQPPPAIGTSQVQPSTRAAPLDSPSHSPAIKVPRGSTQQELHQKPTRQESRESPSNGNNKDLVRSSQSKSVDKGKGLDGEKKNKSTTSKTTRPSVSSWKDNIQSDAKEKVLTIVNNALFGVEGQLKGEVQQESSGNDLSNESRHTGPSTSTSQVN
ncbi:hypothetical protein Cgig2_001102 [Carnegiea gigantea]|uniref:Uncharacterized protein n=1 Tax=Carnegiea gigantea TaxID=171969 RepID=A0A9Q1Q8M6_9CARY|nr:hypothetical protein Cgig2_001102 [Carnegiea gigantea]